MRSIRLIIGFFLLMGQLTQAEIVNFDDITTRTQVSNFGNSFTQYVEKMSQDKLVVVDFWTNPCPGCKTVDRVITSLNRKSPYGDNVIFLKIFVKKYMNTFATHSFYPNTRKVSKVPRVLIFSHGAKVEDFVAERPREIQRKIDHYLNS